MSAYAKDHLKRDPATGTYAIRTQFDDEDPATAPRAWALFGGGQIGTGRCDTAAVDGWDDLFTPEAPE